MPFRRRLDGVFVRGIACKSPTMSVTKASDMIGGLPDPRRLIAVVYADMVGYSRLIADGTAQDLTTHLSHLDGAVVIARESAFTYRGKEVDIRDVGRQLGVRYVLEGSVRKIGDAVRINAQLISTDNGAHVWADRFDQPLHDLQNGQDSAVQRMARPSISSSIRENSNRRPQHLIHPPTTWYCARGP